MQYPYYQKYREQQRKIAEDLRRDYEPVNGPIYGLGEGTMRIGPDISPQASVSPSIRHEYVDRVSASRAGYNDQQAQQVSPPLMSAGPG